MPNHKPEIVTAFRHWHKDSVNAICEVDAAGKIQIRSRVPIDLEIDRFLSENPQYRSQRDELQKWLEAVR